MNEVATNEQRKPYLIRVMLEDISNPFKSFILGRPNILQKLGYRVSELIFRHLVLKGWMKIYVVIMALLAFLALGLALLSLAFGVFNQLLISYTYMFFMFLMLPFFAYFSDVYQAMQLRLGMNIAVREKSYPKLKNGQQEQQNNGKFEWVPTNFAILNAIIHEDKKNRSHSTFGEIAGVDRQTAASAEKKLLAQGLIYTENEIYNFSGVEFEVWVRKGKKIEQRQLSEEEKKRLKYLFEIMCFVAF